MSDFNCWAIVEVGRAVAEANVPRPVQQWEMPQQIEKSEEPEQTIPDQVITSRTAPFNHSYEDPDEDDLTADCAYRRY